VRGGIYHHHCHSAAISGKHNPGRDQRLRWCRLRSRRQTPSIALGSTKQFTATGHFYDLHTQNLTSTATWASNPPSTAGISATGLATSLGDGYSDHQRDFRERLPALRFSRLRPQVLVSISITPPDQP